MMMMQEHSVPPQVLSFIPSREFGVPFRQLQVKLPCVKFPSLIISKKKEENNFRIGITPNSFPFLSLGG
jgi:hypothetical protein